MRACIPLLLLLLALAGCDEGEGVPPGEKDRVKPNRLATERSPYLRQHKLNPVNWYPWGDEAFEKAKAEGKPVFLSIGYAACHWCHVMEHESFEDEATAQILDDVFVCVKVDREERPDVDRVYMAFVQQRTGRGGWPMTVFLTPDRKPFWGGTYLPRDQLQALCSNVKTLWRDRRAEVLQTAELYAEAVREATDGRGAPDTDDSDATILKTLHDALAVRFDRTRGGYGTSPKFPPHAELIYLLDRGGVRMGQEQREQVFITLDAMERGGIHDQVGGGFHRYSTDRDWLLPHFEKMLYDNALLAQAYAGAYAQSGRARYKRAVERLFAWLERELKQPRGGYASSLDADTEGEEGLTYTWTWNELAEVLGGDDLAFLAPLLGLQRRGNFNDEATHQPSGRNIPHWQKLRVDAAGVAGQPAGERDAAVASLQARVDGLLETLHTVRVKRAQPGLDDKVIVAWNGLLLSAFARAGRDLKDPRWTERARELAAFLLSACRRADGTLLRFPRDSGPEIVGFCDDHAHLVEGLLDLAEVTGEQSYADAALDLGKRMNALFLDGEHGGFFATSVSHHEPLIARAKETWDSPIPSDNGAAARANVRLHVLTGEPEFLAAADGALAIFRANMAHPRMAPGLVALIRALSDRMELPSADTAPIPTGDAHARQGVVQAEAFLERNQARPGDRVRVLVRVTVASGWHVNAAGPQRAELVATRLASAAGAAATLEDVRYPPAQRRALGGGPVDLLAGTFDIRGVLVIPAAAPQGPGHIGLVLTFQPCDESSCQAAGALELSVPLRVEAEEGPARHPDHFR
ncbi:MAG: thioredoxin domain-containing protein [Planctomycetota bacterium]|nr:thioredoxin domain-containing protein [Planctomycetota bacterium]